MNTFFKVLTALFAAIGVVLLTMKALDAINRNDNEKKRIAALKAKLQLPKERKSTSLKKAAAAFEDEIADYRFSDDFSFGEDELDGYVEEVFDPLEETIDASKGLFEDLADDVSDFADDAMDAFEEAAGLSEDLSEELLDKLLDDDKN